MLLLNSEVEETVFVDPNYCTQYWHSIKKIEFNDHDIDLAATFTPDGLLEIADQQY
jgi:hypothetical protein